VEQLSSGAVFMLPNQPKRKELHKEIHENYIIIIPRTPIIKNNSRASQKNRRLTVQLFNCSTFIVNLFIFSFLAFFKMLNMLNGFLAVPTKSTPFQHVQWCSTYKSIDFQCVEQLNKKLKKKLHFSMYICF